MAFDQRGDRDCIVVADAVSVTDFTVSPTYTSTIKFVPTANPDGFTVNGVLKLDSDAATLTGWSTTNNFPAPAVVTVGTELPGPAAGVPTPTFEWSAGKLKMLTVKATSLDLQAPRTVVKVGPAQRPRSMVSTTLSLGGSESGWGGDLIWSAGDVDAIASSRVIVGVNATATVAAAGGVWGGGASGTNFTWVNFGTTTLDAAGTATISGDYQTAGTTRLKQGILSITGKAKQSGGSFELLGRTTVAVGGNDSPLQIISGSLIGDGTVQGSLAIGRDGGQQGEAPLVKPGLPGGNNGVWTPGTINVTGDLRMVSGNGTLSFFTNADGSFNKLHVAGQALLSGTFSATWHPDYKPGEGTTCDYLRYGSKVAGTALALSTTFPMWGFNGKAYGAVLEVSETGYFAVVKRKSS